MMRLSNVDLLDDLKFKISKKKPSNQTKEKNLVPNVESSSEGFQKLGANTSFLGENIETSEESWVAGSGESAFFLLDMHPDLGDPIEQLGIEIEDDDHDNVTDFIKRFGEKLLWNKGKRSTF